MSTTTIRIQATEAQLQDFEKQCEVTELMLSSTFLRRFQIQPTQENLGIAAGWMSTARTMGIVAHSMSGIRLQAAGDGVRSSNTPGIDAILHERLRQIHELKHDAKGDDAYTSGELPAAAATYLEAARIQITFKPEHQHAEIMEAVARNWPFHEEWFHLGESPDVNLQKAGALIAAEMDRLKRGEARQAEDLDSSCGE